MVYDKIIAMSEKIKKSMLSIVFLAMLIVAGYIIFVRENMITSRYYFYITVGAFILACIVLLFVIFKGKIHEKKSLKMMAILIVVLVVFQIISLPIANIFSQSFPVWPRGTIYQMPRLRSSVAQTDVGLMMKYYLNDRTLYANEDYPLNSHKGNIYITNEYAFVKENYPILTEEETLYFSKDNASSYYPVMVQTNPKLEIDAFQIILYVGLDYKDIQAYSLLTDMQNTWYLVPNELVEDVFDE